MNGLGRAGDMADEDGSGGARQSSDGMMFGQPIAGISPAFNVLRQVDGAGDGVSGGFAGAHTYEIENRDRNFIAHAY